MLLRFLIAVLIPVLLTLLLSIAAPGVRAERLPITTYGPAEGLSGTVVQHVMRDSRGFVWLSTRDGLSRFDGERFVNYGVEHGLLPNPTINFLLETRAGDYWVATNYTPRRLARRSSSMSSSWRSPPARPTSARCPGA